MTKTSVEQKRIAALFQSFLNNGGGNRYSEIRKYYGSLSDIDAAIREACSFHNDAKTLEPHQYRIRKTAKENFFDNVYKIKGKISNCQNFKELYGLVNACRPKFIGDLAVYDAALRVGAFLQKEIYTFRKQTYNFEPQDVYLHRGTEVGAKKLMKIGVLNSFQAKTQPISEFSWLAPQFLKNPSFAALIEIFLCVKKNSF